MPERDAITVNLGDGFLLIAAGVRREKDGSLAADLMLQNGDILFADRAALNTADGRMIWATVATAEDRPTAARMADAIRKYILPDALAMLQEPDRKPTQSELLVGLALGGDLVDDVAQDVELFHTPDWEAFATVRVDGHGETHALHSKLFRRWLARRFYETLGKTPSSQSLQDAITVLAAKALYDGPEHRVFVRVATLAGKTYLDLGDERWRAVAIDATGWRLVAEPPVKFRRAKGARPLPVPISGGSVDDLRAFCNVGTDADWVLILAWLIGAFRPSGPYPILVLHGEQGSAKSTLSRILRALIDANVAAIRSAPRNEHDLAIAANNGWTLVYDNLSHLPDWLSDGLCRLATGGGFATRTLYENDDETLFDSTRPIVVNGIEEIATRGDLLDRAIILYLPAIPQGRRRRERALWDAFAAAAPAILGALLDAVSIALRDEATIDLAELPRMADFATWVVAAEPALGWNPGAFLAAYTENRDAANDLSLDASLVSAPLRAWATTLTAPWEGTATELLKVLNARADDASRRQKGWPADGRTLSNALRRLAPNLRAAGVSVAFLPRSGKRRPIRIEQAGNAASRSSSASQTGENDSMGAGIRGDDDRIDDDGVTVGDGAGKSMSPGNPASQREFWGSGDAGDARDDEMRSESGDEVVL